MEKARQVSNMYQIDRKAKAVIVWLGPESDDSNIAIAVVDKLAEVMPSLSVVPLRDCPPEYGLSVKEDPIWPALACLSSRPRLFRLGKFQEIALAATAIVCYGNAIAEWLKFEIVELGVHQRRLWTLTVSNKTQKLQ
jgi:hypothetical protein